MSDLLRMTEMTEAYAIQISGWKYPGEFALYNLPPWETMRADGWALCDPEKRKTDYRAFVTAEGQLAAFTRATFDPLGIMLGVGANPDCLSLGYGSEAIRQTVAQLADRHPGVTIYLEVRTWNKRAVRSYEKSGFVIRETVEQETYAGPGEFYRMVYGQGEPC